MELSKLGRQLYDEISKMAVMDAHEHLPPEAAYLQYEYSGSNFFSGGYIWHDMVSAGASRDIYNTMRNPGYRQVSDWWPTIAPYWEKVKFGSYARAAVIAARDLYGIEEISNKTVDRLAESIIKDNTPGLYRRILGERCNIRTVLTNESRMDYREEPEFKVVPFLDASGDTLESLRKLEEYTGKNIHTLDHLVDAGIDRLQILHDTGIVKGFKSFSVTYGNPDRDSAEAVFKEIMAGRPVSNIKILKDYVVDRLFKAVSAFDLPVALHSGVWGDFREMDPANTIEFAQRYPDVRFDLFHLGMPMVREAVLIGKNFRNVTLNLCWCTVLSQKMTVSMLDEILDLIPLNKITVFGADYRCCVQKVWGHLVMTREVVASVLAGRIDAGEMTEEQALDIARMWFYDNPAEIYRIAD